MRDRRKNIRLKEYDYSKRGAYFVTVCTRNRAEILGSLSVIGQLYDDSTVEVQEPCRGDCTFAKAECVGRPYVKYSALGRIAFETLEKIEMKFPCQICDYMIMPDHIHLVLLLNVERATARVAPTEENGDRNSVTLGRIVGAYKSMIADTRRKICDQENVQTGAI